MSRALPAFGLLLLAAFSLVAQTFWFGDPTTPKAWEEATSFLLKEVTPSDAAQLYVHPAWSEAPLPQLHAVNQLVQWREKITQEDLHGTSAVWFIMESDRLDELPARFPDFTPKLDVVHSKDGVSVVKVTNLPSPFARELWPQAKSLSVAIKSGQNITPCSKWNPRNKQFSCPKGTSVAQHQQELDDGTRNCLFMPIAPFGTTTQVTIPADFFQGAKEALFRIGQPLFPARIGHGHDLRWRLLLASGNQPVAQGQFKANFSQWKAYPIKLPPGEALILEAESTSPHAQKALCFNLWTKTSAKNAP